MTAEQRAQAQDHGPRRMRPERNSGMRVRGAGPARAGVGEIYRAHLVRPHRLTRVLMSLAFLGTVLVLRGLTYSIQHDWLPFLGDVRPGGVHVHHFVWGIVLLLGVGYLAVAYDRPRWRRALAVGYGVGAALLLDELALWLTLDDVYWEPAGRISLAAVAVAAVFLVTAHDVFPFLRALWRARGGATPPGAGGADGSERGGERGAASGPHGSGAR